MLNRLSVEGAPERWFGVTPFGTSVISEAWSEGDLREWSCTIRAPVWMWQRGVVGRLPSEIVTPRLVLRLWHPDDAAALGAAIATSFEHLRPWLAWMRFEPLSDQDRIQFIDSGRLEWQAGGDANYGVFRGQTIVGGCGLHRRQGPGSMDLGYWIHVDHTGQGYAVEVARGLTAAAFDVPGIERVEIHHDKANVRSRAVPSSLGFTPGREQRDGVHSPSEVGIDCSWSISRTDWELPESPRPASPR